MIQTECGIFAIISKTNNDSGQLLKNLRKLQHRGRESFGISWFNDGLYDSKFTGVITDEHIDIPLTITNESNESDIIYSKNWLGHVRYSTSASVQKLHFSQPITSKEYGFSLAHNGNIPSSVWSKITLKYKYNVSSQDTTDTYVLHGLMETLLSRGISMIDLLKHIIENIEGVYSLVISTLNKTYICRDRFGVRPICYAFGEDVIYISSESCALPNDITAHYDVGPGEIIEINNDLLTINTIYKYANVNAKFCIFELIYFMRDESIVDSLYVKDFKNYIGKILAEQFLQKEFDKDGAIVCGVPQSGILYGTSFSSHCKLDYVQFLERNNNYHLRTFILKTNKQRLEACKQKYCISTDIENKKVILVDDSIVRGNTLKHLISLVKSYKPKEIHFIVASPPIKHTCSYGVDFADIEELIANQMSIKEMVEYFGFDSLTYLDIDKIKQFDFTNKHFCNACFTGNYLF